MAWVYCVVFSRRRAALRRWQIKQGFRATYGNLLELFVQAGRTECAEVLCEVLRKKCEGNSHTHFLNNHLVAMDKLGSCIIAVDFRCPGIELH